MIITVKALFVIGLLFVANLFLDCLNAPDWGMFIVGLLGLVATAWFIYYVVTYKWKRKEEVKDDEVKSE